MDNVFTVWGRMYFNVVAKCQVIVHIIKMGLQNLVHTDVELIIIALSLNSEMINRFEKRINTEGGVHKSIVIVDFISAG